MKNANQVYIKFYGKTLMSIKHEWLRTLNFFNFWWMKIYLVSIPDHIVQRIFFRLDHLLRIFLGNK